MLAWHSYDYNLGIILICTLYLHSRAQLKLLGSLISLIFVLAGLHVNQFQTFSCSYFAPVHTLYRALSLKAPVQSRSLHRRYTVKAVYLNTGRNGCYCSELLLSIRVGFRRWSNRDGSGLGTSQLRPLESFLSHSGCPTSLLPEAVFSFPYSGCHKQN